MTKTDVLQRFKQLDRSSPQFPDQLVSLLHQKEYKECIPNLLDEEVVWLVNYLDRVLEFLQPHPSSSAFRRCLRELGRICGARQQLPKSYILENSLLILSKYPVASGGSGDIYEGSLDGSKVCIKRLRIYAGGDSPRAKETFHREAVLWKRLTHQNIVPLLGITLEPLQLISPWMPSGELKNYVTRYPGADRFRLLFGIADGLNYLHCRNIVHGDLKGPNILVDDAGRPRITDFGLATVAQNQDSIRSAQGDHGHTARWTAPEILSGEGSYSKEADIFSFAMVMVEVFNGQVPFHPNSPTVAMLAILGEKRPARPAHPQLTDELWELMGACWNHDPLDRPEISEVLKTFRSSNPSFSNDWTFDVSTPDPLLEDTESETTASLEPPEIILPNEDRESISGTDESHPTDQGGAMEPAEGGSTQRSDNSQTTTQSPISSESASHKGQGGRPNTFIGLSPPRRGSDQSPQTPLPIDPPQFNSGQLRNFAHSYPQTNESHANPSTSQGDNDAHKGDIGSPQVDGSTSREPLVHEPSQVNVGSSLHNDSVGETVTMRQPLLRGGNRGAFRSVPALFEAYQAGNTHESKSQNISRHGFKNNPGNFSLSQPDLSGSARNRSQPSPGTADRNTLSKAPLPGSGSNADVSRHEPQTGTKHHNQSQTTLLDSSHSGLRDGKSHDSSGRTESARPQHNGASPTSGTSKGTQNRRAHTASGGKNSSEKEGSGESSGMTAPSPQKGGGIWRRIMRTVCLCCVSDKNMTV